MGFALGGSIVASFQLPLAGPNSYSNSNQAAEGEDNQAGKHGSLWIPQDSTSFYALWTALFTAVLSASTIGLWVANNRTAGIAERALTEHERPWLFLLGATIVRRELPGQAPIPNNYFVSLKWKNIGRSPAIITQFRFIFEDYTLLAERPDYSRCSHLGIQRSAAVNEEFESREVGPTFGPTRGAEQALWGRIVYTELNGKEHSSGYCIRISPYISAVMPWGSDAYDYYD